MKCIMSVDVEDWFHILDLPSTPVMEEWNTLPSHVEKDFRTLLELFDQADVRVTCFFLGWIAERFPHLVTEAVSAGHEIASHGYSHNLVFRQSADEFEADVMQARTVLEDVSGQQILGYRAPGFSLTTATPWYYSRLAAAGYSYSSSLFPGSRSHGGIHDAELSPFRNDAGKTSIVEFPISIVKVCGQRICVFGGGYMRLSPYSLIRWGVRQVLNEHRPVVSYIHPREINPGHPRLPMSPIRRFKTYVNLSTTRRKLQRWLREFEFATFQEFLASHPVG